jgi:hypothetical protein
MKRVSRGPHDPKRTIRIGIAEAGIRHDMSGPPDLATQFKWLRTAVHLTTSTRHHREQTEFIPLTDYGQGARYSLFDNSVACARWSRCALAHADAAEGV